MVAYRVLQRDHFRCQIYDLDYELSPVQRSDMEPIRCWRNAQMRILRQTGRISREAQHDYYDDTLRCQASERYPEQILMRFARENLLIGYGGLTHISWLSKHAEVSFLLDPVRAVRPYVYWSDFTAFLRLLQELAFEELDLQRLYAVTFDLRPLHIEILEVNGFKLEGRLARHQYLSEEERFVDVLYHGLLRGSMQ